MSHTLGAIPILGKQSRDSQAISHKDGQMKIQGFDRAGHLQQHPVKIHTRSWVSH